MWARCESASEMGMVGTGRRATVPRCGEREALSAHQCSDEVLAALEAAWSWSNPSSAHGCCQRRHSSAGGCTLRSKLPSRTTAAMGVLHVGDSAMQVIALNQVQR